MSSVLFDDEKVRKTRAIQRRIEDWIEALRSGGYNQTKGYLHDNDGFCCLGVATDLHGTDWKRRTTGNSFGDDVEVFAASSFREYPASCLPAGMIRKLGIRSVGSSSPPSSSILPSLTQSQSTLMATLATSGRWLS